MQKERGGSDNELIIIDDSLSDLHIVFRETRGYYIETLIGEDSAFEGLCVEKYLEDVKSGDFIPYNEEEKEYINSISTYLEEKKRNVYKLIIDDEYYQEILDLEKNAPGGALRVLGEMHAKMVSLAKPIDIKFN